MVGLSVPVFLSGSSGKVHCILLECFDLFKAQETYKIYDMIYPSWEKISAIGMERLKWSAGSA